MKHAALNDIWYLLVLTTYITTIKLPHKGMFNLKISKSRLSPVYLPKWKPHNSLDEPRRSWYPPYTNMVP